MLRCGALGVWSDSRLNFVQPEWEIPVMTIANRQRLLWVALAAMVSLLLFPPADAKAGFIWLASSDFGLDVNTAAAGSWTVTDLGTKVGEAGLVGYDLNLVFTPGSGSPNFDIPVDASTNNFNVRDGWVTLSLTHAASGNPVEIDFALRAGGNLSAGEKDSFGPTDAGSLTSPTSVSDVNIVLTDDSIENTATSGAAIGVGSIQWNGRGTSFYIEVENGGAYTQLALDPDTIAVVPEPASLVLWGCLGALGVAVAWRRRKVRASSTDA